RDADGRNQIEADLSGCGVISEDLRSVKRHEAGFLVHPVDAGEQPLAVEQDDLNAYARSLCVAQVICNETHSSSRALSGGSRACSRLSSRPTTSCPYWASGPRHSLPRSSRPSCSWGSPAPCSPPLRPCC